MKRLIMTVCVALFIVSPLVAQVPAQVPAGPAPGEIPDTPHFWRTWEGQAKAAAAARAAAREPAKSSPAQELYDVTFYDLDLDLDPAAQLLTGTVTMAADVVGVLRQVDLDLDNALTVDAVRAQGQPVTWQHQSDMLSFELDRDYLPGETITVAVDYHGNPAQAGNAFGWYTIESQDLIWTLSEPYGARTWWPCKDLNHDKADSVDLHIAVPSGLIVASNGLLASEETLGDRTVYHWQERYPICTYLVSVTAYPYTVFTDTYTAMSGQEMPIVNFVIPSYEQAARDGFAVTADMITAFREGFGEYPFLDEKYGHAAFNWGGGMEHQTCTSMLYWYFGEGIISHELAHQWWGDLITCASFHHIWLNEGFATWSEAYWQEQAYGMQAYHDEMAASDYRGPGTIYVENPDDFSSIFDINLSYNKASWVVHMLRGALGDEDFFAGLALYRERFAYGAATTEDFQAAMEDVSGRDLEAFFQQWIYGEYFPRYRFGYVTTFGEGQTVVQMRVEQFQTNADVFTMPIQVKFFTDQGDHWVTVENDQQVQYYTATVPGTVTWVLLDPDRWILRDVVSGGVTDAPPAPAPAALALTAYPNPFNPRTTLRLKLARSGTARLAIHDAAGRLVRTLTSGDLAAGVHEFTWDGLDRAGRSVAAGVYFAVAETAEARETTRLALVR